MNELKIKELFESFGQYKVMIIGDVMIDAYLWGNVERISPEAPVPIVACTKRENRLGGAGNVALNIKALGATPVLCSVIGKDDNSRRLFDLLTKHEMSSNGILASELRKTTVKTRIISQHQHLLRIDDEIDKNLSPINEIEFVNHLQNIILNEKIDVIIFEDYDKGVITPKLIEKIVGLANDLNIPTLVDPKKRNFAHYKGVTLFKPNFKELKEGLKMDIEKGDFEKLKQAAQFMQNTMEMNYVMVTLSELGVFISYKNESINIPAEIRDISDVSGAGDTVISIAALCLKSGLTAGEIAAISNLGGGLVCEKIGVVPIDAGQLYNECVKYFKSN